MEETKKKRKISKWEIVTIVVESLIGLAGVTLIVLGFISSYFPGVSSDNWTGESSFSSVMQMSYRTFGAILVVAAAVIAAFFLNFFARRGDVDSEREERRAQRIRVLSESADSETPPVVDSTAMVASEAKPEPTPTPEPAPEPTPEPEPKEAAEEPAPETPHSEIKE